MRCWITYMVHSVDRLMKACILFCSISFIPYYESGNKSNTEESSLHSVFNAYERNRRISNRQMLPDL